MTRIGLPIEVTEFETIVRLPIAQEAFEDPSGLL
jgi:hypothetical protein